MRYIAFDTETFPIGMFPTPGKSKVTVNPVPRMVCMTSHDGSRTELTRGGKAVEQFVYWLRQENTHLIAHNLTYDVLVMVRAAMEFSYHDILPEVLEACAQGRMHDTQTREELLDISTRGLQLQYNLSVLVKKYFAVDLSESKSGEDAWRLRYNELDPYPTSAWPPDAVAYAEDDAVWAYRVFMEQARPQTSCRGDQIVWNHVVQNEQLQTMAMLGFGLMSAWGMSTDLPWALQIQAKYLTLKESLRTQLQKFGLVRPDDEGGTMNKAEVQRVFAAAFMAFGEPVKMTKKSSRFPEGQISTDKHARNALEDLYDSSDKVMDPRFALLRLWNKLSSFLSTYIDPIVLAHPYPVCTRYGLVASGRSSSSKPNLQNLPKRDTDSDPFKASDIRRAFIPRPGNVFIDADYSTLELRTLAQVCLNLGLKSHMAEALCNGRDLHTDFAAQLLGEDYRHVHDVLENQHDHPDYKRFKAQRAIAKIANFGLPGGLGARGFVLYARGFGTKIDPYKAAELKQAWTTRWPEMEYYFDWIKSLELADGTYGVPQHGPMRVTQNWRTRCCTKRADKSPFNAACNTPFQGMAADGCKLTMWKLIEACYRDKTSPLFGFRPSVFVHDQFLLEGPEARSSAAAHELVRLMSEGMSIMVPDIPIEATVAIGRRWDVDMDSVQDEHGNYSIYEGRVT